MALKSKKTSLWFLFFLPAAVFFLIHISAAGCSAGELISYSQLTGDYWQIWVMNPDGSGKRQLTFSKSDKRHPAWLRHGEKIAYRTSNGQVFQIGRDGGNETEVFKQYHNIGNTHFSPKTNEMVFVRFQPLAMDLSDIWKITLDGQPKDPVLLTRDKGAKHDPVISPQGDKIAFVKADDSRKFHHIWTMNSDGSKMEQLTSGQGVDLSPYFSPDGRQVIFSSNRADGNYEIYRVDIVSKELKRLTHAPGLESNPCYSPDGKNIVFVSNRTGSQQLWVMDREGKNLRQLTPGTDESIDPSWARTEKDGL